MHLKVILVFTALVASTNAANGINQAATQLIQGYEKLAARPYNDDYGSWTVGYGHRCKPNNQQCQDVQLPFSEQAAQQLFARDIQEYATCLNNSLPRCLNDNQYGALISWTYNIGCGRDGMAGSILIRRINNGEDHNTVAGQELPRWNKAGGKVSNGLVNRRRSEVQLFQSSSNVPGNCGQGGGSGGGGGGRGGGYSGYGGYSGGGGGGSYSGGGYGNSPGDYSGYSGGYGTSKGSCGGSPGGGSYSGEGGFGDENSGGGYGGYSGGGYNGYYRKADTSVQATKAQEPDPTDATTAPPSTSIVEDATLSATTSSRSSTTPADFTTLVGAQPTNSAKTVPKASSSFVVYDRVSAPQHTTDLQSS